MSFRLDARDCQLLGSVAEHRVLTTSHLAVLHRKDASALRRRLRELERHGVVRVDARLSAGRRGRPEGLVSLTEEGVVALQSQGCLPQDLPASQVTAEGFRCLDHLLLTNDFRIQLVQMQRIVPAVSVKYLSPTSPSIERTLDDNPMVHEKFPDEGRPGEWIEFTPDGVLALTHTERDQTLLFFLEVDMGTEALASGRGPARDVQQKVVNYQTTYRSQRYKRYEHVWNCALQGFRLLVVANSTPRLMSLCRVVRELPPSDFIFLTDRPSLLSRGVWSDVWVERSRLDLPRQSILGAYMPIPAPAPRDIH